MGALERSGTPRRRARTRPASGPGPTTGTLKPSVVRPTTGTLKPSVVRPAAVVLAALGLLAAARGPSAAQQGDARDEYLRAAAEHFRFSPREVSVLTRWGLSADEIPVVLFVARQAGVSPDVVVARRRQGGSWMEIATGYAIHAGNFHVPVQGAQGFLADAYERFDAVDASQWSTVRLSDDEVVGLVNVRFLARHLSISAGRVLGELAQGDVVEGYRRLRGGGR